MIFRSENDDVKIIFLNERHLDILKSHHIPLAELEYLPKFDKVSDEDCLNWLAFQRAVEYQYCGKSITSYEDSGNYKMVGVNRTTSLYKAKYDELLKDTPKVKLGNYFSYYLTGNAIYILNSDNSVLQDKFIRLEGTLPAVIYQVLLKVKSYFRLFFKENKETIKTPFDRTAIDLSFVIHKALL